MSKPRLYALAKIGPAFPDSPPSLADLLEASCAEVEIERMYGAKFERWERLASHAELEDVQRELAQVVSRG